MGEDYKRYFVGSDTRADLIDELHKGVACFGPDSVRDLLMLALEADDAAQAVAERDDWKRVAKTAEMMQRQAESYHAGATEAFMRAGFSMGESVPEGQTLGPMLIDRLVAERDALKARLYEHQVFEEHVYDERQKIAALVAERDKMRAALEELSQFDCNYDCARNIGNPPFNPCDCFVSFAKEALKLAPLTSEEDRNGNEQ